MKKNFTRLFTILFLSLGLVFGLLACGDDKTDNPNTNNEETYSIVLPSVEHGSVTASSTSVKKGEAVELTVTPDEYYELDFLKANGKDLTVSNGKATINDIQEDQTITAAFVGVDVVVTFVVDGATLETKTLKYGAAYGTLPSVVAPDGYDFSGWYTEANGAGSVIEATTLVANGKAHSVYAYLTAKPLNVTVSGLVDKLVRYPDSESQSALLDIKVLADNVDITNEVTIKVESSDASVVIVDGLTLKVAEGADGVAVVRVLVDGVEFKRFSVSAVDYEGLGYEKVSNKAEFLAMKGTGKYILTADIDLEGDWLANTETWRGLIQTLETDAVIDGNGHVVKNGKVPSGWNNGWIENLKGTVKNIVFLNIDSPNTYPYATGLVGFGKGGTLENIYLQYNILADGEAGDVWKKAGTLIGCLETGHIKNCVVDFVVAPGVTVSNYGAIVGLANNYEGSVTNAYAIVHYSGVEALAAEVGANDIWEYNVKNESVGVFNSVYRFVDSVGALNAFDNNWNFTDGLSVFGVKVLEIEEALSAKIDSQMSFNFEDESSYIDFAVYRYGELSSEYEAVFTSSDENVFTTTIDGAIIFTGKGTAILTIVIDDTITLTTEITISENSGPVDEYTYIHNAEEWRTLITLNPDGKFKLANDIDLAGGWVTPNGESQLCKNFNGELDGQGYVVKNGWMPSGWAQPSAFGNNNGTIKNIGFVNIHGGNLSTDIALVTENFGTIENVFVDWIIETDGQTYGFAGVITGYSGTGTIKNCIVSLRLGEGLASAPSFYGSIIGNANNWNGKLINSYAIVNGTGVKDIASKEAAEGVAAYLKSEGNSAQFETYALLKAGADLSGYDATLWTFTETTISFGGVEVYKEHVHTYAEGWSSDETYHWHAANCGHDLLVSDKAEHTGGTATETEKAVCEVCGASYGDYLKPVDEYTYISTVEEWLSLIPANPAGKFKLTADLDFNDAFITGNDATYLVVTFTGELDGQGHQIKNAKLPGAWAGHGMISYNRGIIRNIAFINLESNKTSTNLGIVVTNQGIMENLYVDYVLVTGTHGDANGVLASNADNKNASVEVESEIRNCIVNIRLAEGATLPPAQGSLVGKAGGWTGYVKNCYAILNDSGIADVCGNRNGTVADATCNTSAQFNTYQLLKAGADLSMYDSNVWSFTDTTISFFGNVVYEVVLEPVDEYTHITTVAQFLELIPANPEGKFKLDNDLDFEGGFIAGADAKALVANFSGIIDGQGHQIKNAKLPGGWAGHCMITTNTGTIKNIAFINLNGNPVSTNIGIVVTNKGIIENLYVDYVIVSPREGMDLSDQSGPIATWADNNSEIRNCIVNLRFAEGSTVLPKNQGSIVGKAGGWTGYVKNSYAIVNNTGVERICANENGTVAASTMSTSAQFETYALLKAGADVSMYDSNIWSFGENSISFFGNVVYEVVAEPVDEYTHISTVAQFLELIAANPAGKFKLDNDLDFEGGFITGKDATYLAASFEGELDGQGHQIKNAKLPGGWAGHALFNYNRGIIKNIAFINLNGNPVSTNLALVAINQGVMENLYVDYVIVSGTLGDFNGVLTANADNKNANFDVPSEVRNCIVNLRLAEGATVPPAQGSLIGRAGGWTGYVFNCYAIINNTGVAAVCSAPGSVSDATCKTSAQFETYALLKAGADVSMYDSNIWTFGENSISFFGNVIYEVVAEPVDEYTHITTVEEWLTLIPANPAGKFKLDNDLDFEGAFIGGADAKVLVADFSGIIDGQGHQIKNAKLPGGWAGHGMIATNTGTIKNIAFINLNSNPVSTNAGLVITNKGLIENLYVDYVIVSPREGMDLSDQSGPIATWADNKSEIKNCIVNLRFAEGSTVLPKNQGSIVGKAGGWTGYVRNCYAIVNNTGVERICANENGTVAAATMSTSAQFNTYAEAVASADVSMYDATLWAFTETSISFGGVVVYSAQ